VTGPASRSSLADLIASGPIHIPSLRDAERESVMMDLRAWVAAFIERFTVEVRVIPPCWEQHNGMAEALSALRDHERGAYADDAPATAAVDFFRAWREIEAHLTEMGALTHCTAHEHNSPRTTRGAQRSMHPKLIDTQSD